MGTGSEHKTHWFTSRERELTVRVCGHRATIYDDRSGRKWAMIKDDDGWPEMDDPRARIGKRMVEWCEGMSS